MSSENFEIEEQKDLIRFIRISILINVVLIVLIFFGTKDEIFNLIGFIIITLFYLIRFIIILFFTWLLIIFIIFMIIAFMLVNIDKV